MKLTKSNLKWWIMMAICPCLAIMYIDQTAVAVTLPKLQVDFGMTEVMQQWVINAYILALAVLILIGGRLSDIFGNRRSFLFGLSGFLLASVLCAATPNGVILIIGRALQGVFGAILMPNTTVVVLNAFPLKERGRAMGIYVGSSAIFLALGPLIGGFFTEFLSWRLVFWINLPFGLLSLFIAWRTISRKKPLKINKKINWMSALLSILATCFLVTALMEGVDFGWDSPVIISLFIFSIICYLAFFIREKRHKNPLINLQILREKAFVIAMAIIFCVQICIISRLFWAVFFQIGLNHTPFIAGLMTMPSTAMSVYFPRLGGKLLDRYGPRLPAITGLSILTLGTIWICIFTTSLNYWLLLFGTICFGVGLSLSIACIFTSVISIIPVEHRGTAAGLYSQVRQVGGTFGVAIIGAAITNIDNRYFKKLLAINNLPRNIKSSVDSILSGTKTAHAELASLPQNIAVKIHNAATIAYAHAFHYGMVVTAVFAIIALILAIRKLQNTNSRVITETLETSE